MITTIFEHSVDLSLLPKRAFILDLGCRGFEFTDYFDRFGHIVYPIDIDILDRKDYYQFAISDKSGNCGIERSEDPQATKMKLGTGIEMHSIKSFSELVEVTEWDLIKMDIEGAEYDVLKNSKHPLAKMVSCEFHIHCGIQTKDMIDNLLIKLQEYYEVHNWVLEERHGAGFNYWDILLIRK